MAADGRLTPPDTTKRSVDRARSSTDSFKEDLQAIGRAVERLREGFAGTAGSFAKPAPGHDPSDRRRALSSPSAGSPTSSDLRRGSGSEARSPTEAISNPLRDWSAGGRGDDSFSDEPLPKHSRAPATSHLRRQLTSSGLLSKTGAFSSSRTEPLAREKEVDDSQNPRTGNGAEPLNAHPIKTLVGAPSSWPEGEWDAMREPSEYDWWRGTPIGEDNEVVITTPSRLSSGGDDEARKRPGPSEGDGPGWDGRMGARKRRSSDRERVGDGGGCRGREGVGSREENEDAKMHESCNLFELRDALRASEEGLLRLTRDVTVGATSSVNSKHGVASFTGEGNRSCNKNSTKPGPRDTENENRLVRHTSPKRGAASAIEDDGNRILENTWNDDIQSPSMLIMEKIESIHPAECLLGDPLTLSREVSGDIASHERSPIQSDDESRDLLPLRMKTLAQLPSEVPKTPSKQLPLSGGAPALGSPLVASAFEGLRKMRSVLLEREREAGRARHDAEKTAERLREMSSQLRRCESRCKAQQSQTTDTQRELEAARAEITSLKRMKETFEAAETRGRAEKLELDEQVMRLRESLDVTTRALEEEKSAKKTLRTRLGALEEDVAHAAERASAAEDEAQAKSAAVAEAKAALTRHANSAKELQALRILLDERSSEVERLRLEVDGERAQTEDVRARLTFAQEDGHTQAREASRARERLKAEQEKSLRISNKLEIATQERTQTAEKLSAAEVDIERLHAELAKALSAVEAKEAADREREEAAQKLETAGRELEELRKSLATTRGKLEKESRRFEHEAEQARSLRRELDASADCRRGQEVELSRLRDQVEQLAVQIASDRNRVVNEANAAAKTEIEAAIQREGRLRSRLERSEADLRTRQDREQEATSAVSKLEAEVAVGRDATERAEAALTKALARIRIAETTAQSHARAAESTEQKAAEAAKLAMHDKEAMRRDLDDARADVAELRAENSKLQGYLARASSVPNGDAALTSGSPSDSSPVGGGTGGGGVVFDDAATAVAAAAEAAIVQAAAAAAKTAASNTLKIRAELESRLALSQAEATEARTEVQRLKLQIQSTSSSEGKRSSSQPPLQADRGRNREQTKLSEDLDRDRDESQNRNIRATLREACGVMERVADALSEAVEGALPLVDDRNNLGCHRAGARLERSRLEQTRGDDARRGGRRRALSAGSYVDEAADIDAHHGEFRGHVAIRAEVREISERLRFTAARLLSVRREEREAAKKRLARLQEEVRDAEARERATAARLEESRELTREQTGFVEGVWQERRHLEAELRTRKDEVERLRVSEDAARTAAAGLEERVEALSSALKMGQARARSEAGAEIVVEAGEAMSALRRQIDELRREVNSTKKIPGGGDVKPHGIGEGCDISGQGDDERSAARGDNVATVSKVGKVGGKVGGKVVDGVASGGSLVFEAEFLRLRTKYDKAKGRIAGLEEEAAASRRATMLARKEFQGAVDALKMSQELLLRVCGKQEDRNSCNEARSSSAGDKFASDSGHGTPDGLQPTSTLGAAASSNAHVRELAAQATRLRDMTQSVRGLLQSVADHGGSEREGGGSRQALGRRRKREAPRVLPVEGVKDDATAGEGVPAVASVTRTECDAPESERLDVALKELRVAEVKIRGLQAEETRLNVEIERALAELGRVQELLRAKTEQALDLEGRVVRAERERREARNAERSSEARARESQAAMDTARASLGSVEQELSDARRRLQAAEITEADLRKHCEELSHASSTFAAEASRQKDERAKWQEHSKLAAANAAELRKRCAELIRKSEELSVERARLERELSSARSESQEVDADVTQVLDALSVSERERKRLAGELEHQSKAAEEARQAAGIARGAGEIEPDAAYQRAQSTEQAGGRDGLVDAGAPKHAESLKLQMKRRDELENERKFLASRVADLEAALVSASGEVRRAAKLGAERGAKYDRETRALKEEIARLKSALRLETTKVQEALKRLVNERAKCNGDKLAIQRETIAQIKEAVAQANAKGAGRRGEQRDDLAKFRERQEFEIASLRKESEELAEALKEETARAAEAVAREASFKATATREIAELQDKLADVERALNSARFREDGAEIISLDPARSTGRSRWLQTAMRSEQANSTCGVSASSRNGADEERRARHRRRSSPGQLSGPLMPNTISSGEGNRVDTCKNRSNSRISGPLLENSCHRRTPVNVWDARDTGKLCGGLENAGERDTVLRMAAKSGAGSTASSIGSKAGDSGPLEDIHSPSNSSSSIPRGRVSTVRAARSNDYAIDRDSASSSRRTAILASNSKEFTTAYGRERPCTSSPASSAGRRPTRYAGGREFGRSELDAGSPGRRGDSRNRREAREGCTASDRMVLRGVVPSSPRSSVSHSEAGDGPSKQSMVSGSGTVGSTVAMASSASKTAFFPGDGTVSARGGGVGQARGDCVVLDNRRAGEREAFIELETRSCSSFSGT